MLKHRTNSPRTNSARTRRLTAALISLLAMVFALASPVSLRADKKKPAAAPVKPGDQRVKAYFDISKIIWPNPPAITRVKFIDLFTGEKIDSKMFAKEKPKQKWMDRLAGQQNTDDIKVTDLPFQLIRTYGVGVDSKGKIYAADQSVGAVFIFDPETKNVELIGNGKQANFALIVGVALDDNDRLFVSDAKLHHVLVFSPKHEAEAVVGTEVLVRPGGIALDRENRFLYVADAGLDVVDVFDADTFKLLRQIGKPSKKHNQTDPGTFSLPECVAVDKDGNLYVTDTFNNRVEIFDADGGFISMFGKNGDGPGDLERPKGIAIDSDNHIWVVDDAQDKIKVFDRQGRLLIYIGDHGFYPGQFMGAWGIAIDKLNRVIVSETFPGRVQMFRYITDAEAAAEKARRETPEQKPAGAAASAQTPAPAQQPSPTANAAAQKN
ncbi:MAG: 6-bladed beta-propeller [Candidatus Sulfotelmatobacter sp.]